MVGKDRWEWGGGNFYTKSVLYPYYQVYLYLYAYLGNAIKPEGCCEWTRDQDAKNSAAQILVSFIHNFWRIITGLFSRIL